MAIYTNVAHADVMLNAGEDMEDVMTGTVTISSLDDEFVLLSIARDEEESSPVRIGMTRRMLRALGTYDAAQFDFPGTEEFVIAMEPHMDRHGIPFDHGRLRPAERDDFHALSED